jgi:hypothetical protein
MALFALVIPSKWFRETLTFIPYIWTALVT